MGQIPGCHGHGQCLILPSEGTENLILTCEVTYYAVILYGREKLQATYVGA